MCDIHDKSVLGTLETARRAQSIMLADGMIDDLVPYWERMEEAFEAIIADDGARQALDEALGNEAVKAKLLSSDHAVFFDALLRRYALGSHDGQALSQGHSTTGDARSLATQVPDVAEFIAHGLYEAFAVPDAYGTFDLQVFPASCVVENEFIGDGAVTGYDIGHGKMLLVTRDGGQVTDVRYAETTESNIALVCRQEGNKPFDWDTIESRDHDALERMGAIPRQA